MAQRRGGEPAERRAAGKAAALLAAGLLLALLLYHAGIGPVLVRLRALGWGAPLVLVPYLVIAAFDALGWRCSLPATARVPLGAVYLARMAGEAVNSLTPTAVPGEPLKAPLLRRWGGSRADFVARLEGGAQGIDARLADFYTIERGAFLRSTLWHLCGWLGGIFEVMLLMALIGTPIGLRDALLVEALAQPIRAVALVIP